MKPSCSDGEIHNPLTDSEIDPTIRSDNEEIMSNRLEEYHNGGSDIFNHAVESSDDKEYDEKKSPSRISAKERMALRNAPLQRS